MWILVIIAALFEIGWATGLKYADSGLEWSLTVLAVCVSFGLLVYVSTKMPASTVYAVFVGIGAVGTVLVDIIVFGGTFNIGIILFVALLVIGVIGLKTVTDHEEDVK
ncbi:Multidrug resistance protein YkkC [Jeotgalicoccus aerolatus]|mgnify:CR=1 FL=1|jgi:paired small multidrug resistance pump|uniref:Paired small multidrug resistance pump n=1 Tax=Jeotgalicoccus aerolatus TaxID=709510 RepID=A0A1G8XC43_9STAP|nr:SMR family transporter [Jeotgalicoccus aerolatus]MBP1952355.1 paired small multidrug resistance pump [Jeotgalicoccus aerolatus]NMA80422.1 chaperonin [Jeotgalicoccus aerolatus]CAD2072749.1 Multidrug resistance protein YkkC [Jeotgalicoccus aerolatus]SDJ87936.1 paired small multidrug resistance pump [Jeotgalicoccus aerolatus]GGE03607.1 multidrug resistance protein YkkC [Jeotgalicoccus aerolatus]